MKAGARATILLAIAVAFAFPGAAVANAQATDILLLLDTTGSMTEALEPAVDDVREISDRVRGELGDVNFGVAEVGDYPITPFASESSRDRPYNIVQPITGDRDALVRALNGLVATGGGDGPEAYGRALRDADVGAGLQWRGGARRLVILVADNVPHDDDLNWGIPAPTFPSPFDTLRDPGDDALIGTGDDIDWQGLMTQLSEHGLPLMFVLFEGDDELLPYWQTWAGWTGGTAARSDSAGLAGTVVDLARRGATAKLPQCPPGQSRDEARRCRPYWEWLGYSFDNRGLPEWASKNKLGYEDVLTKDLVQRTFSDVRFPTWWAFWRDDPRAYLWGQLGGGTCYGMALSGARFSTGQQAFRSATDGRGAAAWEVARTPQLGGPTTSPDSAYRLELLQTLGTDFISQFSTEVRASILEQERHYSGLVRSGQAGAAMRGQLESIMSSGHGNVGASKLSSGAGAGVATVMLQNPDRERGGGHAVVAYNVRDVAGGGFQIDIWDNNDFGTANWITVNPDGSWSYPPIGFYGGKASQLTFLPEYLARNLNYHRDGPFAGGASVSIVDLPAGAGGVQASARTAEGERTDVHDQPVYAAPGTDAGRVLVSEGTELRVRLQAEHAGAIARGHGTVLSAQGLTGGERSGATVEYDLQSGSIETGAARAGSLEVTRGEWDATSAGASGLSLSPSGATTVESAKGGRVSLVLATAVGDSIDSSTLSLKLPRQGVAKIAPAQAKRAIRGGEEIVVKVRGRKQRGAVRVATESVAERYRLRARLRVRHRRATVRLSSLRRLPANSEAKVVLRVSKGKRTLRRRAIEVAPVRTRRALASIRLPKGVRRATVRAVVRVVVSDPGPAELVAATSQRVGPRPKGQKPHRRGER